MKKTFLPLVLFLLVTVSTAFAQKKVMDHNDIQRWKKIEQSKISSDGNWVAYMLSPTTEGDARIELWNAQKNLAQSFPRASEPRFSDDNQLLVFRIKAPLDTLKAMRRRKVKDEDLPKDTLGIYYLNSGKLEKIARLKSVTVPEKWAGWIAYQLEADKAEKATPAKKDTSAVATPADTTKTAPKPAPPAVAKSKKKPKKEDKDNGFRLYVRNTQNGKEDTIAYVQQFVLAEKSPKLLIQTSGKGDTMTFSANPLALQNGVYYYDLEKSQLQALQRSKKGKYQQLSIDQLGKQVSFLADLDTTKARIRPWQLCYWNNSTRDSAHMVADAASSFLPEAKAPAFATGRWTLSENQRPVFSEDGSKLYFGIAPPPVLNDTTLLAEEIVQVEVWSYTQPRMYPQQKIQMDADKKRAYTMVWQINNNKFAQLSSPTLPELRFQEQRDAALVLGFTEEPYADHIQWEGAAPKDLYAIDVNTGAAKLVLQNKRCKPRISPDARFILWWSEPDTAWFAWNNKLQTVKKLTDNQKTAFYNVENDIPDYPDEYGIAGWINGDQALLVYDQYDIWKIDPDGKKAPERLTRGREQNTSYRYLRLDPDERSIAPDAKMLLLQFNDRDKSEGYAWLNLKTGSLNNWMNGAFAYSRAPQKAKKADKLIFTFENYQTFPDLQYCALADAKTVQKISTANPQQAEYNWGKIEPVQWTSLSGETLHGMLVKPENFDAAKKYPMIVTFYERQSDELNRHRAPDFGRSQINWTFYASRGYLIFIPDIPYRTGYPGECAYDAIMSGVTAMMSKGFVDPARIGMQGHSWGGYQSAYLVTRTNLFRCAEAGAPVANMTSAYGGIRYETGLLRAFQYEKQQSRIGGSIWEYPLRYLENSPLFALHKVQTPLLILHNDKDGAVPWTQGVELFNGLRRLDKKVWLLNYNEEPHWPVKLQNRVDFQKRMQQFFDFYLLDAPEPQWMLRGIPPAEKGINSGY